MTDKHATTILFGVWRATIENIYKRIVPKLRSYDPSVNVRIRTPPPRPSSFRGDRFDYQCGYLSFQFVLPSESFNLCFFPLLMLVNINTCECIHCVISMVVFFFSPAYEMYRAKMAVENKSHCNEYNLVVVCL